MKVMLVINDYGNDYCDVILLLYVTVAIIPAVYSQDVNSRPFALTWSTSSFSGDERAKGLSDRVCMRLFEGRQ